MPNTATTIRTVVSGDWTIKIEGIRDTHVVQANNMPLFECAMKAKMFLTGEAVFAYPSLDQTIELVDFSPDDRKATLRIKA